MPPSDLSSDDHARPPEVLAADAIAPRPTPSHDPAPFAARMQGRIKRALGDAFGPVSFGVNLTTLGPGAHASPRLAHTRQDEFIDVLAGHPTLETDRGATLLAPGHCAGFRAGAGPAHRVVKLSAEDVVYLEVGARTPGDSARDPDDDLQASLEDGRWRFSHRDGTPC